MAIPVQGSFYGVAEEEQSQRNLGQVRSSDTQAHDPNWLIRPRVWYQWRVPPQLANLAVSAREALVQSRRFITLGLLRTPQSRLDRPDDAGDDTAPLLPPQGETTSLFTGIGEDVDEGSPQGRGPEAVVEPLVGGLSVNGWQIELVMADDAIELQPVATQRPRLYQIDCVQARFAPVVVDLQRLGRLNQAQLPTLPERKLCPLSCFDRDSMQSEGLQPIYLPQGDGYQLYSFEDLIRAINFPCAHNQVPRLPVPNDRFNHKIYSTRMMVEWLTQVLKRPPEPSNFE